MVLPITQSPAYNYPYGLENPPFAMPPASMPQPYVATPQNKGGILQSLLGGILPGINNSGSGMNVNSVMDKLDQLQRILGLVQKSAPMIQQYGPMVKQLPAMLQMINALNDTDQEQAEDEEEKHYETADESTLTNEVKEQTQEQTHENNEAIPPLKRPSHGQSTPKLFI